jgi:hypothetical protein
MWHSVSMKNKNRRELEKYWAEQAAKKAKAAKKKEAEPAQTGQTPSTAAGEPAENK